MVSVSQIAINHVARRNDTFPSTTIGSRTFFCFGLMSLADLLPIVQVQCFSSHWVNDGYYLLCIVIDNLFSSFLTSIFLIRYTLVRRPFIASKYFISAAWILLQFLFLLARLRHWPMIVSGYAKYRYCRRTVLQIPKNLVMRWTKKFLYRVFWILG